MKNPFQSNVCWWVAGLLMIILINGCASPARKPEAPPSTPQQATPAPREPLPAPKETGPPSETSPSYRPVPASPAAEKAAPPEETYFIHTVKWSGETVSIIAAWYTGDLENWKVLAGIITKNNPNANINRIMQGDRVRIPEGLMKTRDPMPREFVESFYQKPKAEKPPAKRAPSTGTEEAEPGLFGPRESPKK